METAAYILSYLRLMKYPRTEIVSLLDSLGSTLSHSFPWTLLRKLSRGNRLEIPEGADLDADSIPGNASDSDVPVDVSAQRSIWGSHWWN